MSTGIDVVIKLYLLIMFHVDNKNLLLKKAEGLDMRVLWVCYSVLPMFCTEYHIKWNYGAPWAYSLLLQLDKTKKIDIGLCFPIIDDERMRTSTHLGHRYYSYHASMDTEPYKPSHRTEFVKIIEDYRPDVIHIWGSESNHARLAAEAAVSLGMKNKVLIDIQGIADKMSFHYAQGLTEDIVQQKNDAGKSTILEGINDFKRRGIQEKNTFRQVAYAVGRTEWDEACVKEINPHINYRTCNRLFRPSFYDCNRFWDLNNIQRCRIFVSQGFYPLKGLHFLLRAMPIVLQRFPNSEIFVSGYNVLSEDWSGDYSIYGKYICELIEELSLSDKIHFLGPLHENDMIEQYLKTHVFVLPSTIDNSPNSLGEAMLLGVPSVASYVGGVPDMLRNGIDGYTYPCDEHYMLAHYIMKIFANDDLAEQFSAEARKFAAVRHSPSKICQTMLDLYEEIIDGTKQRQNR